MNNKSFKENKYLAWGLTAFLVICAALLATYLIFNFNNVAGLFKSLLHILTPIVDGIALAYLLAPIMNKIEAMIVNPIYTKLGLEMNVKLKKRKRGFSIIITFIIVGIIIYIFFRIVIPQIIMSIQSIIFQFPLYMNNLGIFFTNILENNPEVESMFDYFFTTYTEQATEFVQNNILPQINNILRTLSMSVINFLKATFNLIIGFIISIYLLFTKELMAGQAKKIVYAVYDRKEANNLISGVRYTHKTFIGFVGGKIIDSIIIGILTFIVTSIVGTPYAVLVSVIVGVTNIIPFFGPYIGAIPSALLILMVDPVQCLYFIIIILIIQQVDGNIIGPKILGDSTGLSSFWVIFSITLFGGLFGITGMIIGVPTFAVLYAYIKYKINRKLRHKSLPQETIPYCTVGKIEADGSFTAYVPEKSRSILDILGFTKNKKAKRRLIEEDEENTNTDTDTDTDTEVNFKSNQDNTK